MKISQIRLHFSVKFHANIVMKMFAAKIHYEPCLPSEKQLVLNRTQVGHLIKIIITYKTVSSLLLLDKCF